MDIIGYLVDTRVRIYPLEYFLNFLEDLSNEKDIPNNILKCIGRDETEKRDDETTKPNKSQLSDEDIIIMKKINKLMKDKTSLQEIIDGKENKSDPRYGKEKLAVTTLRIGTVTSTDKDLTDTKNSIEQKDYIAAYAQCSFVRQYRLDHLSSTPEKFAGERSTEKEIDEKNIKVKRSSFFLTVSDIEWLNSYLQKRKSWGDDIPYLHTLLEKADIQMPENQITKRLPDDLEARCVELRARRDREFSTMTLNITVESVKVDFIDERIFDRKSVQPVGIPKCAAMLRQIHLLQRKGVKEKEHQD